MLEPLGGYMRLAEQLWENLLVTSAYKFDPFCHLRLGSECLRVIGSRYSRSINFLLKAGVWGLRTTSGHRMTYACHQRDGLLRREGSIAVCHGQRYPTRQSNFRPCSQISIVEESWLREYRPQRILIMRWNLTDEAMEQFRYVREWRGMFAAAIHKEVVL